ncbi:uncharacterized protein [Arachis hypogaea]|uniref:uncharacterized protein n=1 Tax=Arachis hypogaea TaxID=3818 RepID=UPI000DEC359C|nr:uncharacterized protein LOC112778608 [Arachis hypogaea]
MEKTVSASRKDWVRKLDDALWVHWTVFKTPIDMFPYQLVFKKACYLLVELEYRAHCATKFLNFDAKAAGEKRLLQLNEFDEFRNLAYENANVYKGKTKMSHDR